MRETYNKLTNVCVLFTPLYCLPVGIRVVDVYVREHATDTCCDVIGQSTPWRETEREREDIELALAVCHPHYFTTMPKTENFLEESQRHIF
ncbi:unnamed protein product [Acanthoscelides obtectus]|uniref:Uncharacterized protein n=1 Tax=Acanthoscelides obtectus TaxID=200917 RepID=A0A9P0L4Z8_ACAOB|nr:unnamed protein product [Acanthoscelides obtectus]CAK1659940.1 hypothetical protein AOBTE_LOCUS21770 [Acanthoscelides obtectus]